MDSNDVRQPPQAEQPRMDGVAGDWRRQSQEGFRRKMVNNIIDILKRCFPINGQEGLQQLQNIAIRLEEKIYISATDRNDYVKKIALRMLKMESERSNSNKPNAMPSNIAGMNRNPQDPVNRNMQPEVQNQGQSLPVPMAPNQASASLPSALLPVNSLAQHSMPNVIQNSKMQNISGISQNSVQGADSNYINPPRQQIQQCENRKQYIHQQQQSQQHILKQKLHEGGVQQAVKQCHMQQRLPETYPQREAVVHHQTEISQQPMLQSQQQHEQQQQNLMSQQRIGQHFSISDTKQQKVLGQGKNISSMSGPLQSNDQNVQQAPLIGQQNNILNVHQQQLGSRAHVGQLPRQQQVLGSQAGSSCKQTNRDLVQIMQQPSVQEQSPNASPLLGCGQQHSPQQEMMLQMPSQMAQLQERFVLHQQQPNSLENNMQQMLQTSNPLLEQQNMIDQERTFQAQRAPAEAPSTSLDSTPLIGTSGDWKQDVYQKIKVLNEMYFADLYEIYQKICIKLHQLGSLPQQPKTVAIERLGSLKRMLEGFLHYLQVTKSNMQQYHKDKLGSLEKQIVNFLRLYRSREPGPPMPQVQLPPHMQSLRTPQPPEAQTTRTQSHDCGMNSQLQSLNFQGSAVPTVQPSEVSNLHGSISSGSAITSFQKRMVNSFRSGSNSDLGQGSASTSDQHAAMGSIQQNPLSASHQASISKNAQGNLVSSNISSVHPCSNMLQRQHLKQQELLITQQRQQLKEPFQQSHIQQQLAQPQQKQLQQDQLSMQQAKQQQTGQLLAASHQMNDLNDLKSQGFPQNLSQCERYPNQQLEPGFSFPNSSSQVHQATSPQINQHTSSQNDQQDPLPPLTKVVTPLQSTNLPSLVPSPSASVARTPMPGDDERPNTTDSSLVNAASIIHHKTSSAPASKSSNAMGTPGISASPLLADMSPPESHGNNNLNARFTSGKSGVTQQSRLLEVVKSMSSKALNASVSDIGSVVSMIDQIAGSVPGNGSRAAVSEDLAAEMKCLLQARTSISQDGNIGMKRMRYTSSMPLNVSLSVGGLSDSFKQFTGYETTDWESTATSRAKRPRIEINPALLEEIRGINERLIDTVVDICDKDVGTNLSAAAVEGAEGTFVKCSFSAVALSPSLKSQYASTKMPPIQPLRLLVPVNYPNCSPILLDNFSVAFSKEYDDDLSLKAKSRFSISLRTLPQPMSLTEIARAWDDCTRSVITEYAQLHGGGTFSSKYGTLEDLLSVARIP